MLPVYLVYYCLLTKRKENTRENLLFFFPDVYRSCRINPFVTQNELLLGLFSKKHVIFFHEPIFSFPHEFCGKRICCFLTWKRKRKRKKKKGKSKRERKKENPEASLFCSRKKSWLLFFKKKKEIMKTVLWILPFSFQHSNKFLKILYLLKSYWFNQQSSLKISLVLCQFSLNFSL